MPRGLLEDPLLAVEGDAPAQVRVCIVSYEFVGPTKTGGIGTAYTSLARALAEEGHAVTVLFTSAVPIAEDVMDTWRRRYAEADIELCFLPPPWPSKVASPHANVRRAYEAYSWVLERHAEQPFHVIHYPECLGHGSFIAEAKRHGVAFADAQLVVGVHSPTMWVHEANLQPPVHIEWQVDDLLERRSVACADALVSPSAYMLEYLTDRGWTLPERRFVQPYARPTIDGDDSAETDVRELVFFGRLETRKGLEVFCDALDVLADELGDTEVTFLGKVATAGGIPANTYLEERGRHWPFTWTAITEANQREATEYLRTRPCLAVMPSLVDNSPNTVYEAIALGVPFLSSTAGGTSEIIHPDDRDRATFALWDEDLDGVLPRRVEDELPVPRPEALADALRRALAEPARAVRPAVDPVENRDAHVRWHAGIAGKAAEAAPPPPRELTVVLLVQEEDEPDRRLGQLLMQEAEHFDVLVVDTREEPSELFGHAPGWRVLSMPGATGGRAFEEARQHSRTELMVFLSSGELPNRCFVASLSRAAAAGGEALAWVVRDVRRNGARSEGTGRLLVPPGGPAVMGLFYNPFSTASAALTRGAIEAAGGFSPDLGADEALQEVLARHSLRGGEIEVVAQELACTLRPDPHDGMRQASWLLEAPPAQSDEVRWRLLRPYVLATGKTMAGLPLLSSGLMSVVAVVTRELRTHMEDQMREYTAAAERRFASTDAAVLERDDYIRELEARVASTNGHHDVTQTRAWHAVQRWYAAKTNVQRFVRRGRT